MRLALDFSIVFYWEAWLIISSLISLVLLWSCMIDLTIKSCLSWTEFFSTSILWDSFSVEFKDCLSMMCCSLNLFFSASISSLFSLMNSCCFLHWSNFSLSCSLISYSFLVSFLTPEISDSICKISSFFCLMSSLIAYRALSLCCIPNRDFCQSSSKVFLLMTIFSISMAASFKVFLAAAVSSFWEMSWA
jgi:hypothetical protein